MLITQSSPKLIDRDRKVVFVLIQPGRYLASKSGVLELNYPRRTC